MFGDNEYNVLKPKPVNGVEAVAVDATDPTDVHIEDFAGDDGDVPRDSPFPITEHDIGKVFQRRDGGKAAVVGVDEVAVKCVNDEALDYKDCKVFYVNPNGWVNYPNQNDYDLVAYWEKPPRNEGKGHGFPLQVGHVYETRDKEHIVAIKHIRGEWAEGHLGEYKNFWRLDGLYSDVRFEHHDLVTHFGPMNDLDNLGHDAPETPVNDPIAKLIEDGYAEEIPNAPDWRQGVFEAISLLLDVQNVFPVIRLAADDGDDVIEGITILGENNQAAAIEMLRETIKQARAA